MTPPKTKFLAGGACLWSGILAGVTANRALVELPAWRRLGVVPWADFTRAETHGAGLLFYIVIGLFAILLTVATAVRLRFDWSLRGARRFPAYTAAGLALAYAFITRAILVPAMFRLRDVGTDNSMLHTIFSREARWWGVNDVLHVLAFVFSLWAFAEILASSQAKGGQETDRPCC